MNVSLIFWVINALFFSTTSFVKKKVRYREVILGQQLFVTKVAPLSKDKKEIKAELRDAFKVILYDGETRMWSWIGQCARITFALMLVIFGKIRLSMSRLEN